jgi:hypothetical protein
MTNNQTQNPLFLILVIGCLVIIWFGAWCLVIGI